MAAESLGVQVIALGRIAVKDALVILDDHVATILRSDRFSSPEFNAMWNKLYELSVPVVYFAGRFALSV
eukprot:2532636-Rhodomonas_salina.1